MPLSQILDSQDPSLFDVRSKAPGPQGALPITPEMLLRRPSGDLFGWSQNAGMGWDPAALGGKEILILSTHGGIRAADGTPVALGYHTGHWEAVAGLRVNPTPVAESLPMFPKTMHWTLTAVPRFAGMSFVLR